MESNRPTMPYKGNIMFIYHLTSKATAVLFIAAILIAGLNPSAAAEQVSAADPAIQTTVLTLGAAKQTALDNNPTIAAALERIFQARQTLVQSRAGFFPSLTGTAGWDYTEAASTAGSGTDETLHSSRLSVTQLLFDGFYTKYTVLAAKTRIEMKIAASEDAKRLLAWSVAQAFLNTQLAVESITIARSDMEFNQRQAVDAAAKEKAGLGSYSDTLNFQTKVNAATASLLSAQQDLSEAKIGLAALLGYPDAKLPDMISIAPLPGSIADTTPINIDSRLNQILSSRPDLKELSLAVEEAADTIRAAKADYFPTVTLTAGYGTSSGDHFFDDSAMGATAGINISFDIFSGGIKKSKTAEASSLKREREKTLENAKINAVAEIQTSIKDISVLGQQLVLQEENTRLTQITRDLVEKEYEAGQASLVRLNEAQNDLVSAQGTLSQNKISLLLALEALDYYIGDNIN